MSKTIVIIMLLCVSAAYASANDSGNLKDSIFSTLPIVPTVSLMPIETSENENIQMHELSMATIAKGPHGCKESFTRT